MLLTLDELASRYGLLPSEVLARGDTLDLLVLNTAAKWQKKMQDKRDGKTEAPVSYTSEQLKEIHAKRKAARHK